MELGVKKEKSSLALPQAKQKLKQEVGQSARCIPLAPPDRQSPLLHPAVLEA